MITRTRDLLKALRKGEFAGVVLWQGPSSLDGAPIAAIATGITHKSRNVKTGAMVQCFIIRSDVHPLEALKQGLDASICGNCLHRPANRGSCYVNVGQSVAQVFKSLKSGRYALPGIDYDARILPTLFKGMALRLGAYGDPCAVPFKVWHAVTRKAAAVTSYSHQWRDERFKAFRFMTMASCDSIADTLEATRAGWRSFRVRRPTEILLPYEVTCPASLEAGQKTVCALCRACGGVSSKAKANIAIIAHGTHARSFDAAA